MCARPRKASDEEIFAAAERVLARRAPARWTLADIAAEAGLTASALVQRFGSRRGLLLALAEHAAAATPALFARLRAARASPLAALRAYADCLAALGESPAALAHHLGYLQRDLADPDLRRGVRAQAAAARAAIRDLLDAAVAAGELARHTDTRALARAVEAALSGSLLTWAVYQEGPARRWLRHDLEAALRPFRAARKRRDARGLAGR